MVPLDGKTGNIEKVNREKNKMDINIFSLGGRKSEKEKLG